MFAGEMNTMALAAKNRRTKATAFGFIIAHLDTMNIG